MKKLLVTLLITSLMITGGPIMIPSSFAEEPELVPEPWVHESHEFNVPVDNTIPDSVMCEEIWSLEVRHGDVLTLLMAREMVQDQGNMVDYTFNIHYNVNGTQYIAQFMIMYTTLKVADHSIDAPLTYCDGFSLMSTPIRYNGSIPSFYCNITFESIQVYPDTYASSTFDLTLCHRVTADWNRTDIKVEALFDFSNTTLLEPSGNTELAARSEFTAEIHYGMMVHKAHAFESEGPIMPTGHTNESLQYNLTLDNGTPLTFSRLQMNDRFSIKNSTASYESIGYSSMDYTAVCHVVHGFPGLLYGDTISMKSDPEITVFHDPVAANWDDTWNEDNGLSWLLPILMVGAVAIAGSAILIVRRRRKV